MEKLRLKVNGTALEVNQYPRNGETILLIHFSGGNLAQWNGVIPYFTSKYHIITLDLRGHGKSEKVENGYTLDNMAMDIIGVMDQLGIEKAHILGSSLGGEIAVNLAARFPERVRSVVAEGAIQNYFGENGVYDMTKEEIPIKKNEIRAKRAERIEPVFDSIAEKIEMAKHNCEESGILWNQTIEAFEVYNSFETEDGKYQSNCPKWVIDQYIEDFFDIEFEKYFENIKCPVLMIPSEEEWHTETIKKGIEKFQKHLKSSKVVVIPGGSHAYVALQYPVEFSKVVQSFYVTSGCAES